jgi:hypothetical protein
MSKNQPELKLVSEQVVQMQASYMQVCLHAAVTRAETGLWANHMPSDTLSPSDSVCCLDIEQAQEECGSI